jgi:hypothetical protein
VDSVGDAAARVVAVTIAVAVAVAVVLARTAVTGKLVGRTDVGEGARRARVANVVGEVDSIAGHFGLLGCENKRQCWKSEGGRCGRKGGERVWELRKNWRKRERC